MVATLNEIAEFEDALISDDKGNGYAVCQTSGPPWLVWLEIGVPVSAGYTAPWASVDHIMKKHKYNRTWQNKVRVRPDLSDFTIRSDTDHFI